ncbi:tetratricopeptide repeat protein 24 [Varanus komodoensis]|uniref:tetratricopeptide repeat protein 24 n=1 Tax=Varanus komodoensis TaxID=61221 RepID=UPI001CF79CCF|nr:tetratricopeptide repeat protein 24 [Varanus komodoensis]
MASSLDSCPLEGPPGSQTGSCKTEMRQLLKAGIRLFNANEDTEALAAFKKAYLLSRSSPENHAQATCLFNLGAAYIATGNAQKGLRCLRKAKRAGAQEEDGDFCFNAAAAYDLMGNHSKARELYGKAACEYGARRARRAAEALTKQAYCLVSTGDPASAARAFCLAGRAYQTAGLPEDAAMAMREAANAFLRSGTHPPDDALEALEACGQLCAGITNLALLGKLHNDLGLHYAELGRFEQAGQHFAEALELCGPPQGRLSAQRRAVALQNLGAASNALGHYAQSLRYHCEAADLYGALGGSQGAAQAQCLYNLAAAHHQLKNHNMAGFYYRQAGKAFAEAGDAEGEARARGELGTLNLCQGPSDQATPDCRPNLAVFEKSKQAPSGTKK